MVPTDGGTVRKSLELRRKLCLMSTRSHQQHSRPLLDPTQFEEAGRTLRKWLNLLRTPHVVRESADTSIAWEDGEPPEDQSGSPPLR